MILSQPPCKPVVLDKHASMFGLHHLGRVVTLCLLVGCLVVIACFKIKDGANLHVLLTTFVQTSGIEQIRADVWVATHGLHCLSLYTVRLLGCNWLLEVWQ